MQRPVVAVVAAAGKGTRLGAEVPKAYVPLAGSSLVERSVAAIEASGVADDIIVTVGEGMLDVAVRELKGHSVRFVAGGAERADSIRNALESISLADACVIIHDAARALTPPSLFTRVASAVLDGADAVIPVLPVADTIKVVSGGRVVSTPDRASLRAVQTPQAFDLRTLRAANEAFFASPQTFAATDDASLMEWHGVDVHTVDGDPLAFKVTTPLDLRLAEAILAR
ncbi:2-C-methyl-D-erythritol 4-phosphate cytidylyltransferase [Corynebacterium sp. Q4381]|uniref:2-C-methyl-D-erythritol 4-phosphate cytidylyltransferase n=1 Tax=Corynebacterium sp. Marseille-Q4381 TaxID=3121597 RepID=UPI002FE5251F